MKTGGTGYIFRHGPGFRMFAAIYGRPDPQRLALGGSVEIRDSIAYTFSPDGDGLSNYLASLDPDQGPEHLLSVARAFFQGRVPRFSLIVRVPDAESLVYPSNACQKSAAISAGSGGWVPPRSQPPALAILDAKSGL